jgi:hypothetical protein
VEVKTRENGFIQITIFLHRLQHSVHLGFETLSGPSPRATPGLPDYMYPSLGSTSSQEGGKVGKLAVANVA